MCIQEFPYCSLKIEQGLLPGHSRSVSWGKLIDKDEIICIIYIYNKVTYVFVSLVAIFHLVVGETMFIILRVSLSS